MTRWTAALLGLATACGGSSHNINKPPEPERKIEIKADIGEFSIPNGITGVVAPDPTTNTVVVAVRYRVGANLDPDGKAGLAHLVEHLMFQYRIDGKTIGAHLADHALSYNAFTYAETTDYYTQAPASALDDVLMLEAKRLAARCATLTEEVFAREREVVRNEIRERTSGRGGDLLGRIRRAAFPEGHAFRRDIGGGDADLMNITLADACEFIKAHYSASNMSLVITGGITREEVGAALGKSMGRVGKLDATAAPAARPIPASHLGKRHEIVADVDLPYAIVLFAMPAPYTEERVAADMALDHALSRAAGLTDLYQLGTSISPLRLGAHAAEMAGVVIRLHAGGDPNAAFDAVWRAFGRADDYFSERQYNRIKVLAQTDVMREIDSPWSRAEALLEYHHADETRYFFADLDRINATTRDKAKSAARRVFSKSNAVAIVVRPDPNAKSYRRAAPSFSTGQHRDAAIYTTVAPGDAARPLPLPSASRLANLEHFELDNGIRVILAPTSSSPLVQVRLIVAAGSAVEPAGKSGIAGVAARFLNANTARTADAEIRAALAFYETGGQWSVVTDDDYTMFVATGLEMYVDHLLTGIERQIKAGTYDQDEIERWRKSQRARLATAGAREALASSRALYTHTFGASHPYATRGFPTAADLKNLGVDAANDFRSRHYNGANTAIVISGKFDPALVKKYVQYNFSSWSRGSATPAVSEPAPRLGGSAPHPIAVAGSNDDVVEIDVTFPTPAGVGEHHPALEVLAAMVGSEVSVIRAELGASYGFSARLVVNAGPGMLHISGRVDAERAGVALAALLEAIDGLRTRDAAFDAAFVLARRSVATGLLSRIESTSGVGSRLAFYLRHGLPLDYDSELARAVSQLRAEQVAAAAARTMSAGEARVILTGTPARVQAAFAAAGLVPGAVAR